jgi:DNA-directed RNA polymerase specialized sigma subunit
MVEQKLERNPMAEELAEVLEIPEERVKSLLPI